MTAHQLKCSLSAIAIVFLISSSATAQFTLTGEVRPRTELRNGFKRPHMEGVDPAYFIEQRTRLYFLYTQERIRLNISLQDIRMWGGADQIYKSDPALTNLYEAWASYDFDDFYTIKVGRQALDYDNARFLGNLDWAQQGRSHDALLFTRENDEKRCKLHVGFAFNQETDFEPTKLSGTEYFSVNNYKSMIFAWWHKEFDNGALSLLIHNDGQQAADTSVASRQTYGAMGSTKAGKVKLAGELYYQGGQNKFKTDVSALFVALHGTVDTDITPITLGAEYLSGTSLSDDKDNSFNPLYGTNHKFYGYMDYFYVGNAHGQAGNGTTSGLIDLMLRTSFKIGQKSSLAADLHYFMSPVDIYYNRDVDDGTYGSGLGTEIDLVYTAKISKDVVFNLGYSQMFTTETMEAIKSVNNASSFNNWAWAMIAIKPQLFSTAKE